MRFCPVHIFQHCTGKGLGEWNDMYCHHELPFVCQKDATTMLALEAPLDARYCSDENNSGWKYRTSCLNLVTEKKTWNEAEDFCKTMYSGHLVTLRDITYDMFIEYMLKDFTDDIWIGIRLKNSNTQKWSSGWFVGYEGWNRSRRKFLEGTCATRIGTGNWSIESCTRKLPFVCESSSDKPPVLTSTINDAVCPAGENDWQDLGGDMCYYFHIKTEVTWHEANFMCMQKGGTLACIRSAEESEMLQHFILFDRDWRHIGLYRDAAFGRDFAWLDGTPFDFKNWNAGNPRSDTENCGDLFAYTMKFHSNICEAKCAFICSTRKVLPVSRLNVTEQDLSQEKKKTEKEKQTSCDLSSTCSAVIVAFMTIVCLDILLGAFCIYYFKFRRHNKSGRRWTE